MNNNIANYTRKQNIKNTIDKIIIKAFDIVLYPLRLVYKKYDGSDLQTKRKVKKAYKKLKNDIYYHLLNWDYVYITDFRVQEEDMCANIISMDRNTYALQYHTKKSTKQIFDEIEDILRADESLVIENVSVRDLFKYGYYKEDGRVIKVRIIDKGEEIND